ATDLDDTMTDALINNKPKFVKLFVDNGLNIVDYLTYGRLEELYSSVLDNTLLHQLLKNKHDERRNSNKVHHEFPLMDSNGKGMEFKLYEVSKILRDLLGDVCAPFYTHVLGNITRRHSAKKAQEHITVEKYEPKKSTSPWIDLFIWAILQNRDEMASYFWEM
ncbi:hypothetical protein XELAEV_180379155mg, partial [Xenopus laevis]